MSVYIFSYLEDVCNSPEDISKSQEDVSKSAEDISKSAEYVSKTAEDVSKSAEDVSKLSDNKLLSKNILLIKYFYILSEIIDIFVKLCIILQ